MLLRNVKSNYAMPSRRHILEHLDPTTIRPWVAYRARCAASPYLKENVSPSDGIFYVWRKPAGWDIFPYRYDEFGDKSDHTELWENHLCHILAAMWAPVLKQKKEALTEALQPLTYGFPRGRVSEAGHRRFLVLHGNDFLPKGFVSQDRVERSFSLTHGAGCKWELDSHERCQKYDRDEIISILKLKKETWPAV